MEIECEIHWPESQEPPYAANFREYLQWLWVVLGVETVRLGVVFCDEEVMAKYNARYRGREGPTDVLSFNSGETQSNGVLEGDLLICPSYVDANAKYFGVDPWEELLRVTLHGHLHLLGWDHATNNVDEPMLVHQEKILEMWNKR